MLRRLLDWLEDVPESSGKPQVLGSVALFAFLVQAVTGILLALHFSPAPDAAYGSVRHIMTQITAGRLLRGLHHWGASMMIVVVVLHMTQVFLYGAYKKPREATWMIGVVLLLRASAGWRGRRAAVGTILCFGLTVLVLVAYLVRSFGGGGHA